MEYLFGVIIILFGVYMFSQPDNFFEHTKIRRGGKKKTGDPTKLDYILMRCGGILIIITGIASIIANFLA